MNEEITIERISYQSGHEEGCIALRIPDSWTALEKDGKRLIMFGDEKGAKISRLIEIEILEGDPDFHKYIGEREAFDTVASPGMAVGNDEATVSQADIDADMGEVIYKREMEV